MKKCEFCKEKIQDKATKCQYCGEFQTKPIKPFYKKWWFIGLIGLMIIGLFVPDEKIKNEKSAPKKENVLFDINGEDIVLREGPGESFQKLINEKASKALKETHYLQVDYTTEVKRLETENNWVKIQVVNPSHLSNTHIGWIESKHLINPDKNISASTLKDFKFEIIKTNHKSNIENFHIFYADSDFDKEILLDFTKAFRKEKCTINCNISIYASKKIVDLIGKYPLEDNEYLIMADNYLSMSSFDAPKVKSWYPYQDFKYKELGGKNWKKEPIK